MLRDIDKVKFDLLSTNGSMFIATILLNLLVKEDDSIPTANVDGITIRINPAFWDSLNREEKKFLLAHEAWHVAFEHVCMDTTGINLPTMFKAADYTINNMLDAAGYKMPKCGLLNRDWDHLSTREIYDLLLKNPDPQPVMDTFSQGVNEDGVSTKTKVETLLVQAKIAAEKANQAGSIPGNIARSIDALITPKLPWYTILSRFLNTAAKTDYSYRKPNRRYMPDHFLPSMYSNKLDSIAIATDASGSVTDEAYSIFFTEIAKIIKTLKPNKITLLPFDTEIREEITLKSLRDIPKIKCGGYGGTDIEPIIQWTKENKPKMLIVFSDMKFYFPSDLKPSCPVIWIVVDNYHTDIEVPYGKVIYYEPNK